MSDSHVPEPRDPDEVAAPSAEDAAAEGGLDIRAELQLQDVLRCNGC